MAFGRLFEGNRSPRMSRQSSRDQNMNGSFQSSTTSGISVSHGIISAENSFLESDSSSLISSDCSGRSNFSIDERQIQGNINYYRNHRLNSNSVGRNSTLKKRPDETSHHTISNETLKSVKNSIDPREFLPIIDKEILEYARSKNPRLALHILEKKKRRKSMRNSVVQTTIQESFLRDKKRPPRLKSLKGLNSKSTDCDWLNSRAELQLVISSVVHIPDFFRENLNSEKLTQTIEVVDVNENITPLNIPTKFEFNIPFADIKFNEKIKSGFKKNIYRGSWHGDVIVHEYYDLSKSQINRFWTEVEAMTYISHENITLFMGASMEPPYFAVVMSLVNGPSLFESLHFMQKKFTPHERLNIIRPILQAISYLHAKGKIIKRLNSRNIYLNPRVTLCLLDFSETYYELELSDYVHIPNEQMYYTAPELFETILASYVKESYPYISDNNYLLSPMSNMSNFSFISLNNNNPATNLTQNREASKPVLSPLFFHDEQQKQSPKLLSPKSSQNMNTFVADEYFDEIGSSSYSPPESNVSRRSSMSSQENIRVPGEGLDLNNIDYYQFYQSKFPKVIEEKYFNRETDIFALGTIIYELCANQYPFGSLPIPEIVIKICSQERQSLMNLKVNPKIRRIIELCWSHEAVERPSAESFCRELLNLSSIKKRSTSQPEDLNQIHMSLEYDL